MKVSIITVCKNAGSSIRKTIESVASQSYKNIEYIVIDGGSRDGTLDILKKNREKISTLIREPDGGIYEAMNHGLTKATGDILFFLNSGDVCANSTVIERIAQAYRKRPVDIMFGDAVVGACVKEHGESLPYYLYKNTITHQALFAKRSVFEKYGSFDTRYKVLADLEWEVRMLVFHHVSFRYEHMPVVKYERGGLSEKKDKQSIDLRMKERSSVRDIYYPLWQRVLFRCALGVEYAMHETSTAIFKRRRVYQKQS